MKKLLSYILFFCVAVSAAAQRGTPALPSTASFLRDTVLKNAHVGFTIYDPVAKKFIAEHQGDKYFVPASNVKIVTTYAAMKHLKHLLAGIRYYENDTALYLVPTGDPTLLHRDFLQQPVIRFLQQQRKKLYIVEEVWHDRELGTGWSWDDYSDEYMTERNALPVYGNTIRWIQEKIKSQANTEDISVSVFSDPEVNWKVGFEPDPLKPEFKVKRDRLQNVFTITEGPEDHKEVYVPFITNGIHTALDLLADTVHKPIGVIKNFLVTDPQKTTIASQPLDSVLRPMMYRSDNFFAEQLLLMISEERFAVMDAGMTIDTLLQSDLQFLPQQPVWVDGSGLSRYNLFSPRDFVAILDSMRLQHGMDRIKTIFPTGDSGTLKGFFNGGVPGRGKNFIFAKTGSMSGVYALSGFLYTRSNRLLLFSVMVNNFSGKVMPVRRTVEKFVEKIRNER